MENDLKSSSSGQSVPAGRKINEAYLQFKRLISERNPLKKREFSHLAADLQEYQDVLERFSDKPLDKSQTVEIGCGQRPYRLFYLIANGVSVNAIEKDFVAFNMNLKSIRQSFSINGMERTLKTIIRYFLFDLAENNQFLRELRNVSGRQFDWPLDKITHGDATDVENWPAEDIDFIYSEDVFEHIPQAVLPQLCEIMAKKLSKNGIALIRPVTYAGLMGGHNIDYYDLDKNKNRTCPPWDHLRDNNFPSNTYLNKMTRSDYRNLFSKYFDILDETVRDPEGGRSFMTSEIRAELTTWSDEELYCNHIRFILRAKTE